LLVFALYRAGDRGGPTLAQPSQQQELAQIAGVLAALAKQLGAGGSVVKDFGRLVTSARNIAAAAREIQVSKWMVVEKAAALVQDLAGFAAEVEAAAEKARVQASHTVDVAQALLTSATCLERLAADETTATDRHLVHAALSPLKATLTSLQSTTLSGNEVSQYAADLAVRAAGLAGQALGLREGGRVSERAALEIHNALMACVRDAEAIATTIATTSTALSHAAALMADHARALPARTGGPPSPQVASQRFWL
jgi:hypothetical protein